MSKVTKDALKHLKDNKFEDEDWAELKSKHLKHNRFEDEDWAELSTPKKGPINIPADLKDHRQLNHRDSPNQHTINAIAGLVEALASKLTNDDVKVEKTSEGTVFTVGDKSVTIIDFNYNYYTKQEINEFLDEKQDELTPGEGISIEYDSEGNLVISNTGIAEWGQISGNITDQEDLVDFVKPEIQLIAVGFDEDDSVTLDIDSAAYFKLVVANSVSSIDYSNIHFLSTDDIVNYYNKRTCYIWPFGFPFMMFYFDYFVDTDFIRGRTLPDPMPVALTAVCKSFATETVDDKVRLGYTLNVGLTNEQGESFDEVICYLRHKEIPIVNYQAGKGIDITDNTISIKEVLYLDCGTSTEVV